MGGNYEKGLYNQLMDVMPRLDAMENELHTEKREHKEDVDRLNAKIEGLTQENQLLRDDNARLKSIFLKCCRGWRAWAVGGECLRLLPEVCRAGAGKCPPFGRYPAKP